MPRTARRLVAGGHYHVINRGNNRSQVFESPGEYGAFLRLIAQAQTRISLSILAACLMPNHFHLVVSQASRTDISRWMHWLLTTHTHHHHLRRGSSGRVWQGRFKAFAIERDDHLLTVMRYVERNSLRAGLVTRAENWPWGSLAWRRAPRVRSVLSAPPVTLPTDWPEWVNAPQTTEELAALRNCVNGQKPFGSDAWVDDQSRQPGFIGPIRRRGRPRKQVDGADRESAENR
jgi:putative transposase